MKNQVKRNFNYERSRKLSYLNWKNINLLKQVKEKIEDNSLNKESREHLEKLRKNISGCAFYSLYNKNSDVKYIGSHTCNHRGCNICNSQRQKRIRRKYFHFFTTTPELIKARTKSGYKVYTQNYFNELIKKKPDIKFISKVNYDLMHLTLTVKHSKQGFNGNKYYFEEILKTFHKLRNSNLKTDYNGMLYNWRSLVYGGEFGIETTKNENGLHIHIHALLFVRKIKQNRNILHKHILKSWNKYTVNKDFNKRDFTENEIKSIMKGNSILTDDFIKTFDRRGATLIGLENIFYYSKNGKKIRPKDLTDLKAVQRAVLETISYHFKPDLFETDKETYNIDLICEILPKIYKKQLYGKFGCLYNEKSLGLSSENLLEDFAESRELTETESSEGDFFIVQPAKVYHIDNQIILRKDLQKNKLRANTTTSAISLMNAYYLQSIKGK